jgi:hypothetical protein
MTFVGHRQTMSLLAVRLAILDRYTTGARAKASLHAKGNTQLRNLCELN